MPQRTNKRCRKRGCNQLTRDPSGYCEPHRKQRKQEVQRKYEAKNGNPYNNRRWRNARAQFLANNPLCVRCKEKGIINTATVVDHITPHKGNMALFWSVSNWQALCATCHNSKTVREDGGFGRGGAG